MKTLFSTIGYLVVLFVLPLLFRVDLLFSPNVLLAALVIILLLTTQPPMSFQEANRHKHTDQGTMFLILTTSTVGHIGSIVEWAHVPRIENSFLVIIGSALLVFGLTLRIVAIRTLKNAFSSIVRIKKAQRLFTRGLYSKFRHPSYTGAWLLMLGDAFLFQSYFGFAVLGVGMFLVYLKRIAVEEAMLINEFGSEYEEYMRRTWKLLPGY